ncbi:hypothetical protein Cgig2_000128 [Carnegiea gigantea]|uniref:Uncharacterized protein n=1 Tax=Carnegiea gigantea TaxID=171969 RepID=A0A9Q1KZI8_9CARY|nr:hypothetical protein Cgig2_000128 [Carnegiea gigantea]
MKLVLERVGGASIDTDVVKEKAIAKDCSETVEDLRYSVLEQFFAKPELEEEERKRRSSSEGQKLVGSNVGEGQEMSGKYKAHYEEKRDSDSNLSLEAESGSDGKMGEGDDGSTLRHGGAKLKCCSSGGEGPAIGEYRSRDDPCVALRQGKVTTFKIGGRRVPFSIYDIALFTGLPTIRRVVELDGDEVSTDMIEDAQKKLSDGPLLGAAEWFMFPHSGEIENTCLVMYKCTCIELLLLAYICLSIPFSLCKLHLKM